MCDYKNKVVAISKPICLLNENTNFKSIEDTILHEIAHALTYEKYGDKASNHGKEWKEIAKSIGCSGDRCYNLDEIKTPEAKYKYKCPECGYTYNRYRRIKDNKPLSCSDCCDNYNNGKYSEKYKFVLTEG